MGKAIGVKKDSKATKATAAGTKGKKKKASSSSTLSSKNTKGNTVDEKILYACEFFYNMGITEPRRDEVAKRAGFQSIQTKTVRVCFQKNGPLAKDGLVEFPSKDTILITESGLNSIGHDFDRGQTNNDMLDFIASLFGSPSELKVLNALSSGATYSVDELLAETGFKRTDTKAFREPIGKLKKLGYLEMFKHDGVKMYRLTDKAFPTGRPA